MTDDHGSSDGSPRRDRLGARPGRLQRVEGPLGPSEPAPPVRLCREWKGLTAADLLRDEIVEKLPGRVLSALRDIERGDLAAADRALPSALAPIIAGPGHRPRASRGLLVALVCAAFAAAVAVALAFR